MDAKLSRRGFLKGGAAAAAGLAASSIALPQAVQARTGKELCTVLDLSKCIGCEECVGACREQWQETIPEPGEIPKPFPPKVPIQDWSQRKDVQDRLTPYNFLYIEMLEIPYKGEDHELNIPRRCMHCDNPPCTNLCPFGAGRIESNGVVHIDPEVCLGGAKCKSVCPWHVPQRQSGVGIYLDIVPSLAGNGIMFKCHRCLPLVEEGKQPRCVEVCPEGVQSIGPKEQMKAKAIALAKEKAKEDGKPESAWEEYVYGMVENGGTSTLYVSPIPFKVVNQAIMKKHQEQAAEDRVLDKKEGRPKELGNMGRPPMGPVGYSMGTAENLTVAMAVAPVAGVAAGLAKVWGKVKKNLPQDDAGKGKGGQA